jgi:BirA family transcriptional regulator, biotin operon repressor / biotin---[acetyl-CoA-carboxylase] ligase
MIYPVHPLIELETVDSTNLFAEKLLKSGKVDDGTLVLAKNQTNGRGQGDNRWESQAGMNATFSLILYPVFLPPGQQFLLNKVIALGALGFLRKAAGDAEFTIKWPNDLYCSNRKIGGILIRNSVCGDVFESCIAGIGINLNQLSFGPDVPNPVSLKMLTGKEYIPRDAAEGVVAGIDEGYIRLRQGSAGSIHREYLDCLLGSGEWREYAMGNEYSKGRIQDVDESGMLIVEMEDGSLKKWNHGEIGFVMQDTVL